MTEKNCMCCFKKIDNKGEKGKQYLCDECYNKNIDF